MKFTVNDILDLCSVLKTLIDTNKGLKFSTWHKMNCNYKKLKEVDDMLLPYFIDLFGSDKIMYNMFNYDEKIRYQSVYEEEIEVDVRLFDKDEIDKTWFDLYDGCLIKLVKQGE